MNEDDTRFLATGLELASLLFANGVGATADLLDIGSGYGRLAVGLMTADNFGGQYTGFDILPRHVLWCQQNLTKFDSRYVFEHLDVKNSRYNPTGSGDASTANFPVPDSSQDCAAAFSVFTHLYRANIERYLGEIRRVLRPGGVAVTTWLLFSDERLEATTSAESSYPVVHVLDSVTRYSDPDDPLRAIAYDKAFVELLVASAGLRVESVRLGSWAGDHGPTFQDLVVVRRD